MGDLRVLFVDDETDFRETLIKRMQKRRIDAVGLGSGEEALSWLAPLVEVIMLTGHASLEIAREGMQLGAFDYLMKPVDLDELLYKIEDAHKKASIQQHKIRSIEEVIEAQKPV